MNIGILGTGDVGRTLALAWKKAGHTVRIAGREAEHPQQAWAQAQGVGYGRFADVAEWAEVLVNATAGRASLQALALALAGQEALADKVMIDVANPLDFSNGMPPSLSVVNTDSLGEQIQRNFPRLRVVKALNTLSCRFMVHPQGIEAGNHDLFICGDDAQAKATVRTLLADFGWADAHVIDLGSIAQARGTEQLLPIWIRLWGVLGTDAFNFRIARGSAV